MNLPLLDAQRSRWNSRKSKKLHAAAACALESLELRRLLSSAGFQPPVDSDLSGRPTAAVVADFNGDGKSDAAVALSGDGVVAVLLGKGTGTFQAPVTYNVGSTPSSGPSAVVTADFNGDGK